MMQLSDIFLFLDLSIDAHGEVTHLSDDAFVLEEGPLDGFVLDLEERHTINEGCSDASGPIYGVSIAANECGLWQVELYLAGFTKNALNRCPHMWGQCRLLADLRFCVRHQGKRACHRRACHRRVSRSWCEELFWWCGLTYFLLGTMMHGFFIKGKICHFLIEADTVFSTIRMVLAS